MASVQRREKIGSIISLIFCVGAWSQLGSMPSEAAFFPRMIIGTAFILTFIWGASAFFKKTAPAENDSEDGPGPFLESRKNFTIFVVSLALYIALIDIIGYFSSTCLFMIGTSFALGFRRPFLTGATTFGFIAFIYIVFVIAFQRPLPIEFFQTG